MVFRDARNLIVSEHRMRIKVYHEDVAQLEPFILSRFEVRRDVYAPRAAGLVPGVTSTTRNRKDAEGKRPRENIGWRFSLPEEMRRP